MPTPAVTSSLVLEAVDPRLDAEWDAEALRFPEAGFFHSCAWARVLLDTYGYTPLYLRARLDGRTVGLLPLMEARSFLTGVRGISLPFTDDCETLADSPAIADALWEKAQQLRTERPWKYLETRATPPPSLPSPAPAVAASVTYFNHRLSLTANPDEVFARLHSSTRRAVRKAEKSGLTTEIRHDEEGIRAYFHLHCQTRKFHGLPPQSWTFFRHLHRQAMASGQGAVVLALWNGRPIGGGVFFRFGRISTYKFGASDRDHLHLRPNNLVMWTAIKHFAIQGAEIFDFGRTSLNNSGLRLFKSHWGTAERSLSYHRFDSALNAFTVKGDPASGLHTQIFRKLPIWASRLVGILLYRHVA